MKKRYSEEQVVKILREAASGSVAETCRKYGVSDATYYNWKKKYDGMEVSDVRKLRALEEENRKLKKLLAEEMLDKDALKALLEKYEGAR
jgi:putative transposase